MIGSLIGTGALEKKHVQRGHLLDRSAYRNKVRLRKRVYREEIIRWGPLSVQWALEKKRVQRRALIR